MFFMFQAEDGIRDGHVTGVQTCALPISVGVAASDFRSSAIKQLLNEAKFTAIKGNAGEMAFLVNIPWQSKGVESIDDVQSDLTEIAKTVANEFNSIDVVTGEIDIVYNGSKTSQTTSGHD